MFEREAEEYLKKLLKRLKIKEEDLAENQPEILSWEKMNFISLNVSNVSEAFQKGAKFGYNKVKEELEEERKLNAEIKARFVKCNTCTDEMKSKCLMFTENLCEGERCEELIDIVSLVNKSDLERKIEALEKANEWHYVKDELPPENVPLNIITLDKDKKRRLWEGEYKGGNGRYWTGYFNHFIDVPYAWKEIVLPELPKESE